MSTIKMIIAGIFTAGGLALMIILGVLAFKIKDEVHDWRMQSAIADSVRQQNDVIALQGRMALLDQTAAKSHTVFVQARAQQQRAPVVTGGGKKADSIANAAVNACFEKATTALTDCEKARKTADSLPALKDSLTATRLKLQGLRSPPRWNARAGIFYAWPMKKPVVAAASDFKVPLLPITAEARADYMIMGSPQTALDSALTKQKWRAMLGVSIPFR
jgi:hypothetical protein